MSPETSRSAPQRAPGRAAPDSALDPGPDLALYLVTDRGLCGARGVAETVRRAVDGGVGIVQLRDKHADAAEQLREAERIAAAIDGRAAFVINDRLDVALAARERGIPVDGVHLGQGDTAVLRAREALGPNAIIGLTANTDAHLAALARLPRGTVDHIGVGVIRPTSTKPDHPPALGIAGFARLAEASSVPCVAIGGVGLADAAALRQAGAAGIAVVSALCAAPDPELAARELLAAWGAGASARAAAAGAAAGTGAKEGAI
ncbi:MAG: thiamine phosphate synthase [Leucobacter sp.]